MARIDTRNLQRNMKQAFDGFTTGQKAMLGIAAAAVVIGMVVFTRAGSAGPDRVPLFSDLTVTDASEVAAQLDAAGVAYEISGAGTTILVASDDVYRLRMDMAAQGIPAGGNEGYGLLDDQGITTSQFSQRIGYQRALAGELARTIEAIDLVDVARVQIVVPTDDVFAGDDKQATASVLLQTRGDDKLDSEQVKAIVNLVSNAVPNLAPEQVTVADSTGRSLWAGAPDMASSGGEQEEVRAAYEQRLSSEIESMLGLVYGPGNVRVKVNADLNFDQQVSRGVQRNAPTTEDGDAVAERVTELIESYTGDSGAAVGILGPDGLPLNQAGAEGDGTAYENTSRETVYAINEVTTEVMQAGGEVLRLNVAAVVNSDVVTADQTGPVTQLISTAAGVDAVRGDQITVQSLPFDTSAADEAADALAAEEAARSQFGTAQLVQALLALALVALVLFVAWRSIRSAQKRSAVEPIDVRELEMVREQIQSILPTAEELEGGDTPAALMAAGIELDEDGQPLLTPLGKSDAAKATELIEVELANLIDDEPDLVAQMIRMWMSDRRLPVAARK
jgi:flagellar M-ring protein FliF